MVFLANELDLFKRRMRYILTLPTSPPPLLMQASSKSQRKEQEENAEHYKEITKDLGAKASILKQCCLIDEQRTRVLLFRIADMIDDLTI